MTNLIPSGMSPGAGGRLKAPASVGVVGDVLKLANVSTLETEWGVDDGGLLGVLKNTDNDSVGVIVDFDEDSTLSIDCDGSIAVVVLDESGSPVGAQSFAPGVNHIVTSSGQKVVNVLYDPAGGTGAGRHVGDLFGKSLMLDGYITHLLTSGVDALPLEIVSNGNLGWVRGNRRVANPNTTTTTTTTTTTSTISSITNQNFNVHHNVHGLDVSSGALTADDFAEWFSDLPWSWDRAYGGQTLRIAGNPGVAQAGTYLTWSQIASIATSRGYTLVTT